MLNFIYQYKPKFAKLADVDRDAMTNHIIALVKMSKKRRHAILTLTETEP